MNNLFRSIPAVDLCLTALGQADPSLVEAPRGLMRDLITEFWDKKRHEIREGHCKKTNN